MIHANQPVTLIAQRGEVPAGEKGIARDPELTPRFWDEPATWVFWTNKRYYPRWVPVRLLVTR